MKSTFSAKSEHAPRPITASLVNLLPLHPRGFHSDAPVLLPHRDGIIGREGGSFQGRSTPSGRRAHKLRLASSGITRRQVQCLRVPGARCTSSVGTLHLAHSPRSVSENPGSWIRPHFVPYHQHALGLGTLGIEDLEQRNEFYGMT